MICTTLNKIREHSPCQDGWEKLLKHLGKTKADDEPLPLITVLDSNGMDDCLWCLRSVPEHDRLWRLYAVWCARRVQHLMDDPRSLAALDVAERHANGEATDEDLDAAWAAARDAARDAARYAALAAAWAAARGAEWDAARAAAWAAEEVELRRILTTEGQIMDITKYLEWQKQGRRAIKLEVDWHCARQPKVWCYDYDLMCGASVEPPAPPPTTQQLREAEMARLKAEMEALNV